VSVFLKYFSHAKIALNFTCNYMTIKRSQIEEWDIERLSPYANNAKLHPDSHVEQIANSIEEFTFLDPVAVDEKGELLEGHGRLLAAKKRGDKTIPVIQVTGLTDAQKVAYRLAHNKLTMNTGFDPELLKIDFEFLQDDDFELSLTGFGELELSFLDDVQKDDEDGGGGSGEDDYEPPEEIESRVKLGEIWQLGRHKICCGDSTIESNVRALLGDRFGDVGMVWADPPYGIKHSGKGIKGNTESNDFGKILNDKDVEVAKNNFNLCNALFGNSRLIYWGANYYPSVLANGFGWIVWDKQREGETFSGAELAFVNKGVRLDVFRHQWHGMIKASEHGEKRVHPTQKPVALCEWAFEKYGNSDDLIFDPFLGTAPSIIAAQKMEGSRTVYGFELSPDYCEIIIQRFEKFTGIEAKLIGNL
jgi:DNA modification methylase